MQAHVIYEQPLNDAMRACLRLEHCFSQADLALSANDAPYIPLLISTIIDLMNVMDRPDLRAKLKTALNQHKQYLERLYDHPHIHTARLQEMKQELQHFILMLDDRSQVPGQAFHNHPFLRTLRQQATNPGGISDFSAPMYHMWRMACSEEALELCQDWIEALHPLRALVHWLLQFARHSQPWIDAHTENGFFKQPLQAQTDWHMVRIAIPKISKAFPKMSIGKHGLAINFLTVDVTLEACEQSPAYPIDFRLCCHGL